MFHLFAKKKPGKNKILNDLIQEIEMNAENNYKDAAQQAYKKFCAQMDEVVNAGVLDESQMTYYMERREEFAKKMAGYTHKDQKCTW